MNPRPSEACEHYETTERAWCQACNEWCYEDDRCVRGREVQLGELVSEAVLIDGEHHKQWFLERIAHIIGADLPDHESGVMP